MKCIRVYHFISCSLQLGHFIKSTSSIYYMKILVVLLIVSMPSVWKLHGQNPNKKDFNTPYGNNQEVGKYVTLNGAKLYFEEYGKGEPLFLIHGSSGDIRSMSHQIEYFKTKYRVIVADNRGHGKSELKTDSLTYAQITEDWESLGEHLELDSINIIGWSDGGIIGLKMGISNKCKIKKIVSMAGNLRPDTSAVHAWAINQVMGMQEFISARLEEKDTSQDWMLGRQVLNMLIKQPNIPTKSLSDIKAKVLVMAGDMDIIKNKHTVEIFENIPSAHLCISS